MKNFASFKIYLLSNLNIKIDKLIPTNIDTIHEINRLMLKHITSDFINKLLLGLTGRLLWQMKTLEYYIL